MLSKLFNLKFKYSAPRPFNINYFFYFFLISFPFSIIINPGFLNS